MSGCCPAGQGGPRDRAVVVISWGSSLSAAGLLPRPWPGSPLPLPTAESPARSRRYPGGAVGGAQVPWQPGISKGGADLWGVGVQLGNGGGSPRALGLIPTPRLCPHTEFWAGLTPFLPGALPSGEKGKEGENRVSDSIVGGGVRGGRFSRSAVGSSYSSAQLASRAPSGPPSGSCPPIWAVFIGSQPCGW